MITCPNCSTSNPDEAQVCLSCGAPLVEAAELLTSRTIPPAEEDEIPEPSPFASPEPPEPASHDVSVAPGPVSEPVRPPRVDFTTPKKDRSLAIVLEIVPGLFGLLGIGWIYSGFTGAGLAWLVGFLLWNMIALVIAIFTAGIGCLCTLPVNLVVLIASVMALNSQILSHNEQFKP
jgi:hypothetical protein